MKKSIKLARGNVAIIMILIVAAAVVISASGLIIYNNSIKKVVPEPQLQPTPGAVKADALPGDKTKLTNISFTGNGQAGTLAAEFESTDLLTNKTIKLSDFRGKIVILDFWSMGCPPCRIEIPGFVELQNKYGKDGLEIIGICFDTNESAIRDFMKAYKMNYHIVMGGQQNSNQYGGIYGIPTTFIIGKDGRIEGAAHIGYRPKEIFEQDFLKLK